MRGYTALISWVWGHIKNENVHIAVPAKIRIETAIQSVFPLNQVNFVVFRKYL